MATKKIYTVINTDLLSGTDVAADLVSVKVFNVSTPVEVENGSIVELEELTKGSREVWKGKLATSATTMDKAVIIATPEVMYDDRAKDLCEFINEAGVACRGYVPRSGNIFSITKEGFKSAQAPAVKDPVAIGNGGKLEKSGAGTAFGTCVAIDVIGGKTFYAIKIK